MSFSAVTNVITCGLTDGTEVAVLIALAHCLNEQSGKCCPSTRTVARLARRSENVVRKTIKTLGSKGLLSSTQEPGGVRYFTLNLSRLPLAEVTPPPCRSETPPLAEGKGDPFQKCKGNREVNKEGNKEKKKEVGRNTCTPTKNGTSPLPKTAVAPLQKTVDEQVIQQVKEQVMREPRASSRFVPPEVGKEIERGTYSDWLKVRKVPMTATAWKRFVSGVGQTTLTLQQAVELCAEKGWRGFDPSWEAVRRAEARLAPKDETDDMSFEDFNAYLEKKKREEEAREREERRKKDAEEERRIQAQFEEQQRKERAQLLQYLKESEAHGEGNGQRRNSTDVQTA